MDTIPSIGSQRLILNHRQGCLPCVLAAFVLWSQAYALTIIPTFDSSIINDPQAATIQATINGAIALYESNFSDPITVKIYFLEKTNGLGSSISVAQFYLYADYTAALLSHATSADDATALAHLPNGPNNPVNNNTNMFLNVTLARALGLENTTPPPNDGAVSLNTSLMNLSAAQTDTNKYSLFAAVSHEIDEVLGFGSNLDFGTNGPPPATLGAAPEDLFRYDQNGVRSFSISPNAVSYFSLDGATDLARFNQNQRGDFGDWYSPGGQTPQVQDAFGTPGASPVPDVELRVLDVIGYARAPAPVWVDFNYTGTTQNGRYLTPFETLGQGITAVNSGGTINIKPGLSHETMKITKPMTIVAVGGAALIGR